jgi:hypothetical protein
MNREYHEQHPRASSTSFAVSPSVHVDVILVNHDRNGACSERKERVPLPAFDACSQRVQKIAGTAAHYNVLRI